MKIFKDFFNLFYPEQCLACSKSLYSGEKWLCLDCLSHLPKTNFWNEVDNPVARLFWGRSKVYAAAAFLFFTKSGRVQHLMHQLKYKNKPEIGVFLGKQFGIYLSKSPNFSDVDMIIPVPLHPKKQKKRGYNQSERIASGLSESTKKPLNTTVLLRGKFTETQTRKSRFSRWENVNDVFHVADPDEIKGKHVLLVDDVITTGATIEACVNKLNAVDGVRVSVVSLAVPMN